MKFLNKNIKSIAIYGLGYLGECLHRDLKNTNINVEFVIDKNHLDKKIDDVKIIYLEEIKDQYPVDVIVVTTIKVYDEIKNELRERTNIKIVSLQEVIDYFDE